MFGQVLAWVLLSIGLIFTIAGIVYAITVTMGFWLIVLFITVIVYVIVKALQVFFGVFKSE